MASPLWGACSTGMPPVSRSNADLSPPAGFGVEVPPPSVSVEELPFVSVVIATRERAHHLTGCLESFRQLDYPGYELIVVDNVPLTGTTAEAVEAARPHLPQLRYVVESTPGSSAARNRGISEARGDIIAFTDDDVVVGSQWLRGFVRGFRSATDVGCVTGLVLPYELETLAQVWFEQYGGFCRGFERRVFDLNPDCGETPLYPYTPGSFGAGASMAFRADVIRQLQGFDPCLGPGTRARAGEDLDVFLRVILRGHRLVYEPSTLVWHRHRKSYPELKRQIHDYGMGMACLATKLLLRPPTCLEVIKRLPRGVVFLLSPSSPKNASKITGYPILLSVTELLGMLRGPSAYLSSRLQVASRTRSRSLPKMGKVGETL